MPTRNITDLVEPLRILAKELLLQANNKLNKRGYFVKIIETKRTPEEQEAYYLKGRASFDEVVKAYEKAGLPKPKDNNKITWTKKSKHIEGKAFDIGIFKDGKYITDKELYKEVATIGRDIGLECGAFWGVEDLAHYELKEF